VQAGLPDLVAGSLEEYRARLLALCAQPSALRRHREYLERTRYENALFDTPGFARDWERLLERIYDESR
jgi:predicted O-linked N-acetylglucosamine transferase (SPINDLY family)